MRNPVDWVKRMLAEKPKQNHAPPRQMGIVKIAGRLELVHPETPVRGVKLVTISAGLEARHDHIMCEFNNHQLELQALPQSLRKRKARKAKVSMPDLDT